MKSIFAVILFVFAIFAPAIYAQQETLAGDWAGGSNLFPNRPGFIQAHFEQTGTNFGGSFNAQSWDAAKRMITNVRVESARVHFEFPSSAGTPFVAYGEITGDVIEGTITRGGDSGKFHLVRLGKINPQVTQSLIGAYQIEKEILGLITWGAFGGQLRVVTLNTGAGEALLPLSEDKFFFGRSVVNSTVPTEIVTFTRNASGEVAGFKLENNGKLVLTAPKVKWANQEQVKFNNGAVSLAGTVFTPSTNLKHSAVVFVHGSQDRGRDDNYLFQIAKSYLDLGIAVLVFDKRGVGGSSGDWHTASFEDLADDVLAGVSHLRKRADINGRQIGLEGISQGGWIAPIAAARDPKISFLILISAAGVSSKEQVIYDQLGKMRRAGVAENELKEAEEFLRFQFEASRDQKKWREFEAKIPAVKDKKWFPFTLGGIPETSWIWESTRRTSFFEPVPVWQKIKCPVLLIFGGADSNYPAQKSAEIIKKALHEGGNRDITVKIFEGANHSILVQQPDGRWMPAPDPDNTKYNWLIKKVNVDF